MVSETITTQLKKYGIGNTLRRLRLRKSMGLLELSKHTGLFPALLSKLERDVMHPTLPTLARIAMVFSVGLEYFFNSELKPILEAVRKTDRLRFLDSPGASQVAMATAELGESARRCSWCCSSQLQLKVPNRLCPDSYLCGIAA